MTVGRFITLEGGEGVGKSTLAAGLQAALEAAGIVVVRTREPGGSPGADDIRRLIVTGAEERWSGLTETLLLIAARNDHLERTIRPALARGCWVICDRYADSTYAYQVAARGIAPETLEALHSIIGAPQPDLTLVLDLAPAIGLARARSRMIGEARYESFDETFHAQVRQAFLDIAA
ncbi:MAG: dTMP kinase, partial [Alphaproteobacteria bacterium]|nr:dTMP kinase [Alphaproteobacteria bacterium]